MMKDLRESIMVDVKDMMDENMKEFMREIATSVRNDIKETLKDAIITKGEESKVDLTPNSQPEPITQDTPQQTPRDEQLNNLIEEMKIGKKNLTRGNHQHYLKKLKTKKTKKQQKITVNPHPKREPALGSPDKKTLLKGQKQVE